MNLKDFYKDVDIEINQIKTNSKLIEPGDLFVCIKGANFDRHEFIDEAARNGAVCAIVSKDVESFLPTIKVADPDEELLNLLKWYYDNPQDKLTIIGITGTDGKTTTAKIVQELFGEDICGYIGTIGAGCKDFFFKTSNTTPPAELQFYLLNEFVKRGMKYVSMEASSEGFFYHRLNAINFDLGCLTNITSEHLNTHKTLENYISCKKELFIRSNRQILNSKDLHFDEVKEVSKNYKTYGYKNDDDLCIMGYELFPNKTHITFLHNKEIINVVSPLLGKFNVENLALAISVLLNYGYTFNEAIKNISKLVIPGRMQVINLGQNFHCICDYAHTTNAVKNVLEFANTLNVNRIITVIGQAGGRDQFKRKEVGKYTLELSNYAILTMDDPRYEDVNEIIDMMLQDTDKTNYERVIDRAEAIRKAVMMAEENDLLLFLGKGSDPYMAIEDRREYYLESIEIEKAIKIKLGL